MKPMQVAKIFFAGAFLFIALISFSHSVSAANNDHEQLVGSGNSCTSNTNAADWDTIAQCVSSAWQRGAYFFGPSASTCDASHAGLMQYTAGNLLQICNGTAWLNLVGQ